MRCFTDERRYPTAEEVERVASVLDRTGKTMSQIHTQAGVRGDRVGPALRLLMRKGIACFEDGTPKLWRLTRRASA